MSKNETISVEHLIKNKVELKRDDSKVIETSLLVPRLGGKIEIAMTKGDVRDFLEVSNDKKTTDEQYKEAGYNLIYSIVKNPNLKDEALQKTYECQVPTDIVKSIFDDGEIIDIIEFASHKGGFTKGSIVEIEEVKN